MANVKISNLPTATTPLTGAELVPIVQSGVTSQTTSAAIVAQLNASSGASSVGYLPAGTGAVTTTVQAKLRETVSVKDFGAVGDGVTDDTDAISKAFSALKAANGGDLIFPDGDYRFNLDISGVNPRMQWIGQGQTTFRPYLAAPTKDAIIYANNSSGLGTGYGVNIIFRNIQFTGRFSGDVDPQYGRVGACVSLTASWATFYDCSFTYGINAGFASLYGQYNEFYSCSFGANVSGAGTAGCLLNSNTDAEAANENTFIRCKFNTNKNGLVIKGGVNNRVIGCNFQNTVAGGVGALVLQADSTGFGTTQNYIAGNYFEANSRDVHIEVAVGQTFEGNIFLPGTIYTTNCYDLRFIGNTAYGTPVTSFNHPVGNTDIASLTWLGNNFDPTVTGLAHAAATILSIENASTYQRRKDNLLTTTAQTASLPVNFIPDWCGVKSAVPKATATSLFSITLNTNATSTARVNVFTLELFLWDDAASSTQYGYSGHLQRFSVFISTNTSGSPQVFLAQESSGTDLGINTGYQSPGSVTMTSTVVGNVVTFKGSWAGTGTGSAGMAQQAIAYILRGAGTNSFYLTRL